MPSSPVHSAALTCHPDVRSHAVHSVRVSVRRSPGGMLAVSYSLEGDLARLRVPGPRPPRIAERLWEHTCCEIFIARKGLPAYHEFNLAPSGEWAAYAFARYRDGTLLADDDLNPRVAVRGAAESWALDAVISLDRLSPMHVDARAFARAFSRDRRRYRSALLLGPEASAGQSGFPPSRGVRSGTRMKFGIDRLLQDPALRKPLAGCRVALLAHPASVTRDLVHSLDALAALGDIELAAAFGPQHGLRGDKQDNMIESPDFTDPVHGIPVFSLYGEVRRPTAAMMESFDVLLVDLQDVGCRIYTFVTTLRYVLEAAAERGKRVWVLDRPNPVGRPVEGLLLRAGWESFVGAGPLPMRHGLTLGELARWFVRMLRLNVECEVVTMEGWKPARAPGYGWAGERAWVNPSPNAPNPWMARCYAGTVMLEGTTLSEGRGTTRPLELFGAPDLEPRALIATMESLAPAGCAAAGCGLAGSSPRFTSTSASSAQAFRSTSTTRPTSTMRFVRGGSSLSHSRRMRALQPDYELWRDFPYEYERGRLAIDLINGSELLREWVDDAAATAADLDALARPDEEAWREEREAVLLYR